MIAVYREHAPCPALRPFVETFWTAGPVARDRRVLPDGCIDFLFTSRETRFALEAIGAMTTWQDACEAGAPRRTGVRFRPAGAALFLPCPASELTDASVPLEALWGDAANLLGDRLAEAPDDGARVRALETALVARLPHAAGSDAAVARAADRISRAGAPPLPALAEELGLSSRQLRRRFLAAVGLGPKRFARIARFRGAIARARLERGRPRWSRVALEAGYSDQAHMIGDFRELAGRTPVEHWAAPASVSSNPRPRVRRSLGRNPERRSHE